MHKGGLTACFSVFALATAALVVVAYEPTEPALYVSLAIVALAFGVVMWKVWSLPSSRSAGGQ